MAELAHFSGNWYLQLATTCSRAGASGGGSQACKVVPETEEAGVSVNLREYGWIGLGHFLVSPGAGREGKRWNAHSN
jgi:hypothetical protein